MLNIPQTIKDLFKTDGVLKNIRISFPNGEYGDICNDRIIKESLKFDESISSREEIKWGLCEASQLSFDCVDVGNIKGMEIEAAIEIDVTGHERTEYPVDTECPVFLKIEIDGNTYYIVISDFPEIEAEQTYTTDDGTGLYYDTWTDENTTWMKMHFLNYAYYASVVGAYAIYASKIYFYSTKEEKFYGGCVAGWTSSEHFELSFPLNSAFTDDEWLNAIHNMRYDSTSKKYWGSDFEPTVLPDVPFPFYRIPLGRFIVDECKRDAGMTRRKIVAYSSYGDFSLPRYIQEETSEEQINLYIINFMQVASRKRFLNESLLNYTPLPIDPETLNDPYQWSWTPAWNYQDGGTLYDVSLSTVVTYGYVNMNADDFPSMRVLLRCNDTGILDADRDTIEYQLGLYLAAAMEYTGDNAINYSESNITKTRNLIKNAIRPLPYISSAPLEYLIGIEVGDIYPASSKIYFIENIEMTLRVKEHDAQPTAGDIVFQYTFDNHRTIAYADYDLVDTSYYPQNTMVLKGDPVDDTGTAYTYTLSFLNLNSKTILEDCIELNGCFGRMGRDGCFQLLALAEVPIDGLFPAHDIYPASDLYPRAYAPITEDVSGLAIIDDNDMISLWYEEYFIQYGTLICEYTSSEVLDENDNPTKVVYEDQFAEGDGLMVYDLSNNAIIKSGIWTSAEIQALVDPLVQALKRVKFYPSDLTCVGLPYIEAGDWVLASYHGNQILGLVLSRTLSGIQALRDKMKSD